MTTPTIYQLPQPLAGSSGILPVQKYMVVGDNLATVTTAGYLNGVNLEGFPLAATDIINCIYSYNPQTQVGTFEQFGVTISNGVITLVALSGPGQVTLPTIANHIAIYTNTAGHLSEDAATAINGGNIQAGLSGTAGTLASFPATAASGSLKLIAIANTGNTITSISNVAMGQASVLSIPDPANAVGRFLIGATATPFVSGNFPQNSGTGGLMVDSGIAVSAIATTSTAVLLNPLADQTINANDLTVAAGVINSGLSTGGQIGLIKAFPITANSGFMAIQGAVNATGNFGTTILNSTAQGQAQAVTIPDSGAATAAFLISALAGAGTQHITSGNLQIDSGVLDVGTAGGSTMAGTLNLFSQGNNLGSIQLVVANNAGNFQVQLTNASHGQSTVYTVPDIGAATGDIVVSTAAVRMKSVAGAAAAGGNAAQSFTDAFCTSGSNVIGNWNTQANPAMVLKIVPGNGSFVVTSDADAGVGTFNYVIMK